MSTKITYTRQGDYNLPNLKLPDQEPREIGVWGAGVRWTPLPQAEAPTEPTGETNVADVISKNTTKFSITIC